MNRYKNPWFKSCNTPRPEFYENDAPQVLEHRGVKVYRLFNQAFDFVLNDCCITQRAGITEAKREIDEILDGKTPVCSAVYKHLKRHGFKPLSYEYYTKHWKRLDAEQRDNVSFAMRWMDGDKLYSVKHVKGDAWKALAG